MTQVRDLMSYGALTVQAGRRLADIVGRLRRIGHEGYPVVDTDGQIVGLLTARDMNRATENGLEDMRVEDVMMAGQVSVSPETAVHALLAQMVATDWGQIPVVENNALVGIVTRTDVIRHYAQLEYNSIHTVTDAEVRRVLGEPIAALIAFVAKQAAAQEKTIYMVGGVVRDLLLKRPNLDIDFVLEGDAMAFAQSLDEEFGGVVKTHEAFGTATWTFDDTAAGHIGQPLDALPEYIDLVTTRFEFYEEPAVLPTVYNSGIRLDLRRRDFTINALAVKLSANGAGGEVIDLFGGLRDLEHKQVRVLHSLSFADDPTRILRGVRFAHRLGFKIEPRTAQLIENALPMLKRTTGERLRNEITLLLKEPQPEEALLKLQRTGVLQAIHPAFVLDADLLRRAFTQLQAEPLIHPPEEEGMLRWVLVATSMDAEYAEQVANRMLFKKATTQAMKAAAQLTEYPDEYFSGKPSDITFRLEKLPLDAVLAVWVAIANEPEDRAAIANYITTWRHVQIITDGNDLKHAGLQPGPHFKTILQKLRAGRINGAIASDDDEKRALRTLIESE